MEDGGKEQGRVEEMVKWGYRQLLFSEIKEEQLKAMVGLYTKARANFEANPNEREAFGQPTAHAAAIVVVANALLNLDEVIVKN